LAGCVHPNIKLYNVEKKNGMNYLEIDKNIYGGIDHENISKRIVV
jgi:hypothetical protein